MKKAEELAGDDEIVRNEGLLTAEVDGELMAMSIERGTCYSLNAVGTRVWDLLAEPRTFDDLCALLLREYAVEPTQCRSELLSLLEDMRAEGLAVVRSRG